MPSVPYCTQPLVAVEPAQIGGGGGLGDGGGGLGGGGGGKQEMDWQAVSWHLKPGSGAR